MSERQPVGSRAEVHLSVSRYRVVVDGVEQSRVDVKDEYRPSGGWTSCLLLGHRPATTPKQNRDAYEHWDLDCPCDVECPRCGARPGHGCSTTDGGGMSGGGYSTKAHAARIKVSPRCQGLLDGSVSRCDLGAHDWHLNQPASAGVGGEGTATCSVCGRTEPVQPREFSISRAGRWVRRLGE